MLDNITSPAPTVFRLSPLATWAKMLARQPGVDHYAISDQDRSISGSGTLQRFPRVIIADRPCVPILAHSHVYPLSRGGQYAAFTSKAYWFDAATGALVGSCVYSDNRSYLSYMSPAMGPWDWQLSDHTELALPAQPITVDFAQAQTGYTSAWSAVRPAMGHSGSGIGQGNAYARGDEYNLPGQTQHRRVSVETGQGQGIVGYRWALRTTQEGYDQGLVEHTDFWVNTGVMAVQYLDCSMDVVSVDDTEAHSWVSKPARWTRLG